MNDILKLLKKKYHYRSYKKVIPILCIIALCTVSIMMLPAHSANDLICGLVEHTHNETCYEVSTEDSSQKILTCDKQEHTHDESCYSTHIISDEEGTSIFEYAESIDGVDVNITIAEQDGTLLIPDEKGNYTVTAGEWYKVNLGIVSKKGITPGRYYCTFPEGITFEDNVGNDLYLTDTTTNKKYLAGTWSLQEETNRIIFDFNDGIKEYTNLTINATVNVTFGETDQPLEFDGQVNITVLPNDNKEETEVSKWARSSVENADPTKIYWEIHIKGNKESHIVGSEINDQINTKQSHYYSESDMRNGIKIYANYTLDSDIDHEWIVYPGDAGLSWTEDGWTYTIPKTIYCHWCKEEVEVGDDDWEYYLKYTSTRKEYGSNGYVEYDNTVSIDGDTTTGKTSAGQKESTAKVVKRANYQSNNKTEIDNDVIQWTITASIPGAAQGEKYDYYWHLWDETKIVEGTQKTGYMNDLNNAIVTATINNQTINVPKKSEATDSDQFCWNNDYSAETEKNNGIWYAREIDLFSRCTCTEETCSHWENGNCTEKESNGFCRCWCTHEDVTLTFCYETPAANLIEKYGGRGAELSNSVQLNNLQLNSTSDNWVSVNVDSDSDQVPIPGIFTKVLSEQVTPDNNQIAEFTITFNEVMKDFSRFDDITITDTMSETLIFLPSSLVIMAEDADEHQRQLVNGTDYECEYEATTHVITIKLLNPGQFKYTLVYNSALYIPSGGNNQYSNTAEIKLEGHTYTSRTKPTLADNATSTGENYSISISKIDAETNAPLKDAIFGLYSRDGVLICQLKTDENGEITVETDISKGIFFYEHTECYFQEMKAPDGYVLNPTKYWFWFCHLDIDDNCQICHTKELNYAPDANENELQDGHRFVTGVDKKLNTITVTNQKKVTHILPETGGYGIDGYILGGITLMSGSSYWLCKKKKHESEGGSI